MMLKDVLLYLLSYYSSCVQEWLGGRKKIQKLMFLVDYDVEGSAVRKLGLSGAEYKILVYGPYSDDVANAIEELVEEGKVEEIVVSKGFSQRRLTDKFLEELKYEDGRLYLYRPITPAPKLRPMVKERVEYVVDRYGGLSGGYLEKFISEKLRLTPVVKEKYFGVTIDEYLGKLAKHLC